VTERVRLSRELSQSGATAISTGLAFAAINFLAIAQLLQNVDARLAWIPVVLAGVVMLAVRGVFAELDGMRPSAAGIRVWLAQAMNGRVALVITLTYMTTVVLVVAADAYIIGEAVAWALHASQAVAIGLVALLLALATWINLRGIKLAGRAEQLATFTAVVLTLLVGVVAILHPSTDGTTPVGTTGQGGWVQAFVLGIFIYVGFEWVTTNSEEVTRPAIIPRAMLVALGILAISWAVFSVAMGVTLDNADLTSAYPQLLVAQHALGQGGMPLMLAVTALTAVNTFNGGFITLSRFMYALAREGTLPRRLSTLNDRAVPSLGVVVLGVSSLVLAVVVAVTGSFAVMVSVGAALETGIYASAAYVVWRLRRREPDAARPYRARGGRPLALTLVVVFALLTVVAATSVGATTSTAPLLVVLGFAVVATAYVLLVVPRLERREAEELAARRAARAAQRSARRDDA
jgi:APA family basic amino acid/polyamine antiporter